MLLDPPIRFRILPRALRVRIPARAPGYSPAAAVPTPAGPPSLQLSNQILELTKAIHAISRARGRADPTQSDGT
jgi:hypothetical protein